MVDTAMTTKAHDIVNREELALTGLCAPQFSRFDCADANGITVAASNNTRVKVVFIIMIFFVKEEKEANKKENNSNN